MTCTKHYHTKVQELLSNPKIHSGEKKEGITIKIDDENMVFWRGRW